MFCRNCGTEILNGELFCAKCGTKVDRDNSSLEKTVSAYAVSEVNSDGNLNDEKSNPGKEIENVTVAVNQSVDDKAETVESSVEWNNSVDNTVDSDKENNKSDISDIKKEVSAIWRDWTIIQKIGEGSFGEVYKAQRNELGTEFYSAIKIIRIPKSKTESDAVRSEIGLDNKSTTAYFKGFVDECVNEIKLMESFKGTQNIVSVEDYKVIPKENEIGWTIYIRMELLTSFIDYSRNRALTEKEVIKLGIDICNALEFCAKLNVMHRDIKPENIFVSSFGFYKLGDFGIARKLEKASSGMSKKGTYNYMAPEVYKGSSNYDYTADIYSLGIVMYKLLNNNRLPFVPANAEKVTYQQMQSAFESRMNGVMMPKPINASTSLSNIILKACDYNPSSRFRSASEFKRALQAVLQGKSVVFNKEKISAVSSNQVRNTYSDNNFKEVPKSPEEKEKKKMSTGKKVFLAILAILLIAGITAGVIAISWYTSPDQKIIRAMEDGDFDSALDIYEDDGQVTSTLVESLEKRIENLKTDFKNDKIEYTVAKMELNTIKKMNIASLDDKIEEAESYIDSLNASKTAFNTAESFYDSGEYDKAIEQYKLVIEEDNNYNKAKDKLAKATEKYRESVLSKAEQFAKEDLYTQAITEIENALNVIPNDSELTEALTLYKSKNESKESESLVNEAKSYADKGDYENAIRSITSNKDYMSDKNLSSAFAEYEAKYVEQIQKEVDEKLDSNYDDALATVKTAKSVLPDNKEISDLYDKVVSSEPTKLSAMKMSNSEAFEQMTESGVEDSLGNLYSPGNLFMISSYASSYGYAEFFSGNEYKKLSGVIATADESEESQCRLEFYVGNDTKEMTLVKSYNLTRTTKPQNISVDISGYEWVKIQLVHSNNEDYDYYTDGKALLADFYLK